MTRELFSRPRCGPAVRLRLKPKAPPGGYVDGAWWPYSKDLMMELPSLLRVLTVRLGSIDRVMYRVSEWTTSSRRLLFRDRLAHLNWSLIQPANTVSIHGAHGVNLNLLVIAPDTEARGAHISMMAAAAPGNHATVAQLLSLDVADEPTRTDMLEAQSRWDTEGGMPGRASRAKEQGSSANVGATSLP
ncbi:Uncharacterised protein [Mycobacteroides abscessus subsp. abscessus]|nr:DUF5994 family protein [Mycobacteroides abscessus]SKE09181.1 Uncharacterised protein [Mycobacteroides abscessus subsp. abscessus]SKV34018.1 Uncharacterised protein [Mycobacteroides abscessus subsp. massiliense]SKV35360.1 Uncharacterised protein [Mycobacteroides abscessus subsp. massiliense]